MKNKHFIFGLFSIFFTCIAITSCQKKPEAAIASDKTVAITGEKIYFSNKTLNALSYQWDFGDGTNSTDECPIKSFVKAGNYEVKMTAFSKGEKKMDIAAMNITILEQNEKFAGNYQGHICETEAEFSISKGAKSTDLILNLGGIILDAKIKGPKFDIPEQKSKGLSTGQSYSGYGFLSGSTVEMTIIIDYTNFVKYCSIEGEQKK